MDKLGQLYNLGEWTVKPGMVEAFIEAFQRSFKWIAANDPGAGEGVLLQDMGESNKFISFGWSTDPEKTTEVLASPEFQALMADAMELLVNFQPRRMKAVVYAAPSTQG